MRLRHATLALFAITLLAAGAVGCSPATQYNKGIEMSYHPSGKADAQERLVNSAVELKQDSDQQIVKDAGGVYLGELEVLAAKTSDFASGSGGQSLAGRVSLEAANRGATHYYLAASSVEHSVQAASGPHISIGGNNSESVAKTKARFVLYRVEQASWEKLPKSYQPDTPVNAVAAKPAAAPPETKAADPAAGPKPDGKSETPKGADAAKK